MLNLIGNQNIQKQDSRATWKHQKKLKFTFKEQKEYETIESDIEKLEDDMSVPNAEALLVAKKAELMKLHEIHEKLKDQLHQITAMKMAIYDAHYRKK